MKKKNHNKIWAIFLTLSQLLGKHSKIYFGTFLTLKLREEIEDDEQTYCKNAKFQKSPNITKIYY